jgi:hypothetical protein
MLSLILCQDNSDTSGISKIRMHDLSPLSLFHLLEIGVS